VTYSLTKLVLQSQSTQ